MDPLTILLLFFIAFISTILLLFHIIQTSKPSYKLPPGPYPYPIIGNILELLRNNPVNAFTQLSKTYGPIMTLKLGNITTIVISSPEIAKKALQKDGTTLSSRTIPYIIWSTLETHCQNSLVLLPSSSAKWRSLRRASATKIFSPQQLDSTQLLRKTKVQELLDYVHKYYNNNNGREGLNIGEAMFKTVLNLISNTLLSMDLVQYNNNNDDKCEDFKDIIVGLTEEFGRPNVVDFFPLLRFFDQQGGARAKARDRYAKAFAIFDGAIEERIIMRQSGSRTNVGECNNNNDVLDSLLDSIKEDSSQLSRHNLVYFLLDLFAAGVDTTSSTLEWAMAELLHNPKGMHKVRKELQQVIDKDEQVDESHISKLPYLNAVVKETLRLHPPAPFLIPRKSNEDVELGGFMLPKNAQILINVWSIGRDSTIWNNPTKFEPERFLESQIDFKGTNFEFIPFGAGRRICPGLSFGSRTVHFMLASLLHHFNWKLVNEMKAEDMDMSFSYGVTVHKAQPLCVIPIKN